MPTPEPDGLAFLAKWLAIAFAALGTALGYNKMIEAKITAVDTKADGKATTAEVDRVKNSVDVLFTLARENKDAIMTSVDQAVTRVSEQQHRDRDRILSALGALSDSLNHFRADVAKEMGTRPTRDEMRHEIELHQQGRK